LAERGFCYQEFVEQGHAVFADSTKKPQVFGKPGGPLQKMDDPKRLHVKKMAVPSGC
jgi:hypothetical protein